MAVHGGAMHVIRGLARLELDRAHSRGEGPLGVAAGQQHAREVVVRSRERRRHPHRPLEQLGRLLALPVGVQRGAQIVHRLDVPGGELERAAERGDGLGEPADGLEHHAEVVVDLGRVGGDAERRAEGLGGAVGVAQLVQHHAEIVVRLDVARVQCDRRAIVSGRGLELAEHPAYLTEVVVVEGLPVVVADGLLDQPSRLLVTPLLVRHEAHQMQRVGVLRARAQDLVVHAAGPLELAGLMQGHGLAEHRLQGTGAGAVAARRVGTARGVAHAGNTPRGLFTRMKLVRIPSRAAAGPATGAAPRQRRGRARAVTVYRKRWK